MIFELSTGIWIKWPVLRFSRDEPSCFIEACLSKGLIYKKVRVFFFFKGNRTFMRSHRTAAKIPSVCPPEFLKVSCGFVANETLQNSTHHVIKQP